MHRELLRANGTYSGTGAGQAASQMGGGQNWLTVQRHQGPTECRRVGEASSQLKAILGTAQRCDLQRERRLCLDGLTPQAGLQGSGGNMQLHSGTEAYTVEPDLKPRRGTAEERTCTAERGRSPQEWPKQRVHLRRAHT